MQCCNLLAQTSSFPSFSSSYPTEFLTLPVHCLPRFLLCLLLAKHFPLLGLQNSRSPFTRKSSVPSVVQAGHLALHSIEMYSLCISFPDLEFRERRGRSHSSLCPLSCAHFIYKTYITSVSIVHESGEIIFDYFTGVFWVTEANLQRWSLVLLPRSLLIKC